MAEWFEANAKLIADGMTAARASLIVVLPWLGLRYGIDSLPAAVWLFFRSILACCPVKIPASCLT